jgi:hypothetical protein
MARTLPRAHDGALQVEAYEKDPGTTATCPGKVETKGSIGQETDPAPEVSWGALRRGALAFRLVASR